MNPSLKLIFIASLLMSPMATLAAKSSATPLPSTVELPQQAEQELANFPKHNLGSKGRSAQDSVGTVSAEQTEMILKLEDNYEAPRARELLWTFGFFVQQFQPQGTMTINNVEENLSDSGSTVLPSLSFGSLYNFSRTNEISRWGSWQWGVEAEAGFTSQKVSIPSSNGNSLEARLNTTMMEIRTLARWGRTFESPFHFRAGIGRGRLNYTQSSDNSLARWTESGMYNSFLLGADYQINEKWHALLQGKSISVLNDWPTSLDEPSSQLELGAQVVW